MNHGRNSTYKHGCRCEACRKAHNDHQRVSGANLRIGARGEQKRAWDRDNRPLCECGQPMARGSDRCNECRREDGAAYRRLVEDMWAEGMTAREIADALGWRTKHPGQVMVTLRRSRGYNLPHRRTPAQIARITAGSAARLAKARAVYAAQRASVS